MKKLIVLTVLGVLFGLSVASAAEMSPPNGDRLVCRFEGFNDQTNDFRCFVRIDLRSTPADHERDRAFLVRCNNGFELESRDFAISNDQNNTWINADERGKLASLRIKDFLTGSTNHEEDRFRADLLLAARGVARLEGFCRFDRERE
ncbi:MAG: hypothetical protein NDJ90_07540 [Oligoflexia bacterium]|nr:hypothetical protein [Oligoflexia bacterium]